MEELRQETLEQQRVPVEIVERSPSIALRLSGRPGDWKTLFVTRNIAKLGYSHNDLMSGRIRFGELIHPDDRGELIEVLRDFSRMRNDKFTIIYRLQKADGGVMWVSEAATVVRRDDGEILYTDCILSDYTQTRTHLERLRDGYRQQTVLNEILQGIHDSDLDHALRIILERSGEYLDISRVILYQDSEDGSHSRVLCEWVNSGCRDMPSHANVYHHRSEIPELRANLDSHGYRIVCPDVADDTTCARLRKEGVVTTAVFSIPIQGRLFGFIRFDECRGSRKWSRDTIAFLHSVARLVPPVIFRKRNEYLIREMAITDQLTGLRNRRHLEARLAEAITQARRIGLEGYVLFIDMDDFKIINDAYGHDYGDAILREVAAFLKDTFGSDNRVFRFGGDEFVILVEDSADVDLDHVIGKLMRRAQFPWQVIDRSFYCTLSIGVTRFPDEGADSREVIQNADIAMYEAKKNGKNNFVHYSGSLFRSSVARAEMESSLRGCIEDGFRGFEVFYQPLVDRQGSILGAEALVRWMLDGRRLSPVEFIPLAEYLGLIVPLGDYVMARAAECCREINRRHPDFFISINASVRQFRHAGFYERAMATLAASGVDIRNVVLEITEGMAMHDLESMKMIAGEFRRSGLRISMDDFGTGYSSLGNMRDLPIDVVKIDRAFIRDVTTDAYSESFIRLITDLVHSMRRRVVVEGVETREQLAFCDECGVDYVQGYYFWPPMPERDILSLLEA